MHCISKTNRISIEIHFYGDTISINGKEYFYSIDFEKRFTRVM